MSSESRTNPISSSLSRSNGAFLASNCCAIRILPPDQDCLHRPDAWQADRARSPSSAPGWKRAPAPATTSGESMKSDFRRGRSEMATSDEILSEIDAEQGRAIERLFAFLKIPSISAAPAHFPDCERAADWLVSQLAELGFEVAKHATEGRPMVVGQVEAARRDAPHVLFYGHYDVQPADPLNLWRNPPFEPKLEAGPRGERIVARGASDDKGQLMTFLEACRAFKSFGGPPCAMTVLVEGEEETGSPSLPSFLAQNARMLKADVALVCDTSMWRPSTPAITTALRGIVSAEVILRGANRDLHSGVFGGAAVNPIHVLCRILGDLHDAKGAVALPGFYDGVE